MYSGNNHIHFGTSNTTNQTGTSLSAEFPKYAISFNQSSPNITDLESALNFIAKAYNNHTKKFNTTKIVIDSEQTTIKPRYKHIYEHGNRPQRISSGKKLLTFEELAKILKKIRDGPEKKRQQFFFRLDDKTKKIKPALNSGDFLRSILRHKDDENRFLRLYEPRKLF